MLKYWGFFLLFIVSAYAEKVDKVHAIAARGFPKYKAGFSHFDFVNPNAPKKGEIIVGDLGGFDSLNPWILKGVAPKKINLTRTTLMGRSPDEPFTMYGVVAESMEMPKDRAWIIFNIRPEADGIKKGLLQQKILFLATRLG